MITHNSSATARVSRPHRTQVEMQLFSLDQMLAADHRARTVWAYVRVLNLEPFYRDFQVTASSPGRTAIAPEILLALWLLATLEGIGSARELARRCETDIPYLWILGTVSVNYHTLSDFRVQHGERLLQLLVDTVAVLVAQGIVPLDTIAQDGMRVRASAGRSSFRRKPTLEELQQAAQEHVTRLQSETESESERQPGEARRKAAIERAARERQERVAAALQQLEQLSQQREQRQAGDGEKTRVSTTDPEARVMKMANGGYDPAYNVQFATDAQTRVIVGVDVTNAGTDGGELLPMLGQLRDHYDRVSSQVLVDSAYVNQKSVQEAFVGGTNVISTVPRASQLERSGKDPHARQPKDSDEYAVFRACMADPESQQLYKTRPSIAEFPNADCRNRNLKQFRVRGLIKVKAVALWHAITFNFLRLKALGAFGILAQ